MSQNSRVSKRMKQKPFTIFIYSLLLSPGFFPAVNSAQFDVLDPSGGAVTTVMVSRYLANKPQLSLTDDGYPAHGISNQAATELTLFTDAFGRVEFPDLDASVRYRFRKAGFSDVTLTALTGTESKKVIINKIDNIEQLAQQKTSNLWLSQLDFGGDNELKKQFQLNCAFCHQQASLFMRGERSINEWLEIIERMGRYGSRLAEDDTQQIAAILHEGYKHLREDPKSIPEGLEWEDKLNEISMTEWPIGDGMSQMHDFLVHPNGMVYVGDNLQDRIYEVDPENGQYTVYKVPHEEGARVGGVLGNRFDTYPKMYNYMGVHSFAVSEKDGNIFITPSMQQALLEFNPNTKQFTVHDMPEGFYPHTIRVDHQDRVWFTLALSSQVAMFDRDKKTFSIYDLPARNFKEWLILKLLPVVFWIDPKYRPLPSPDRFATGVPMPYGIDVAPNGIVWVSRLYGNDIARIDPEENSVTMIATPFDGPRRVRVDAENNVWIVGFQESLIAKYDPGKEVFTEYPLPIVNELPYALNVDRKNGVVWVNGNQSDSVLSFDIAREQWRVYPLPRKRFFSRDIEFGSDGSVYTTNSHFPSWQIEDGQPTLIRIQGGAQ